MIFTKKKRNLGLTKHQDQLQFLTNAAMELFQCGTRSDIFTLIAQHLQQLCYNHSIVLCSYNSAKKMQTIEAISIANGDQTVISEILNRDPIKWELPINQDYYQHLMNSSFVEEPVDFTHFSAGQITVQQSSEIIEALHFSTGISFGFTYKGELFAIAGIYKQSEIHFSNMELLKAYIAQASLALQKYHSEVLQNQTLSLLHKTLDSLGSQMFVIDRDFNILFVNAAFQFWLEQHSQSTMPSAQELKDFINQHDPEGTAEYERVFAEGVTLHSSYETTLADKEYFFNISHIPVFDENNVTQIITVIRDISEHVYKEREKQKISEQLQQIQRLEAIGRLAGGVAHDFNNSLAVIISLSEILEEDLLPHPAWQQDIIEIRKSAQKAAELTSQLLAFSKKQLLQPQCLNINETIINLEKMLTRFVGEDIILKFDFTETECWAYLDKTQFEQILLNLAINAREDMPKGGHLHFITKVISSNNLPDTIEKYLAPTDNYVVLSIKDDGAGMDQDALDRIFEPFFTSRELGKGSGLGLATVFGVVQQSNGYITAHSKVGHGTSFTLYFPYQVEDQHTEPVDHFKSDNLHGNEAILIVEDDDSVRLTAEKILNRFGYTTHTCASPSVALFKIEEENLSFDLLVTDVVMPGMSGFKLANKVSVLKPETKTLYMSGYVNHKIIEDELLHRHITFLRKPFHTKQLLQMVRQALGRS